MKWDKYGFVVESKIRKDILLCLAKSPTMPSELTKRLTIDKSQVTRALKELEKKNLAVCLTPDNKKGRLYGISKDGKNVAKRLVIRKF